MTVVRPFRALRYDTQRVDLSNVIVPPYDVIAPDERASYFDRDPHNAIRFELTRDVADEADADYSGIRETLDGWRASGVLVQDEIPAYYVMGQRYSAPSGDVLERIGFFAELGLEEYETRVVRPHERTLAGPKADRLKLLRAAGANLSSVFLLYEDREDELTEMLARTLESAEIGTAQDSGGVEYRLGRMTDAAEIARLREFMAARPSVIADGHHRYETALEYRRQQDALEAAVGAEGSASVERPWHSTIAYFTNAYAPGSLLLPIHRVVREVPAPAESVWREKMPSWSVRALASVSLDRLEALIADELSPRAGQAAFLVETNDGMTLLIHRSEPLKDELMVRIIEKEVLGAVFRLDPDAIRAGAVSFPKSARRAGQEVREGEGTAALYLNPLTPDDVFRATAEGEVMPPKSTFFSPKIPTGMVFRDHRGSEGD